MRLLFLLLIIPSVSVAEGYLGVNKFNSMGGNSPTTRYYLGLNEDLTEKFGLDAYGELNNRNDSSDATFKIAPNFYLKKDVTIFLILEMEVQSSSPSLFRNISYIDDRAGVGLEYKAW